MTLRYLLLSILILAIWPLRSSGAPAYEVVAEFERPPTSPSGKLVYVPATGLYYGTTTDGGAYDLGTVFSISPTGVRTTLISFTGTTGAAKGANPESGLILTGGILYGTTAKGGTNDCGTVFRVTTGGAFLTLVQFTGLTTGATRGATPDGLVQSGDLLGLVASFYGTTEAGGANGLGTIYNFTIALDTLVVTPTTLKDFTGTSGAAVGERPVGALVTDSGGTNLYGVTHWGGSSDFGTVFKYHPAGLIPALDPAVFTIMVEFKGVSAIGERRGANPSAGLIFHPNGVFYGTTTNGGANDAGVVFKMLTSTTTSASNHGYTVLSDFNELNGSSPTAELIVGPDGDTLFGTTSDGGDGFGTVFSIGSNGGLLTIHSFSDDDGASPLGPLLKLASGDFVGTTSAGGPGGYGTVFQQSNPTFGNTYQVLANFTNSTGWRPAGSPAFGATGNTIYQPMALGGSNGDGTLLQVDGSTPSVLTSFTGSLGEDPNGALRLIGSDLYGVNKRGGTSSAGTVYHYFPGGSPGLVATLVNSGGGAPEGPVVQGPDGFLYCVAREGGSALMGAILKIDPNGGRATLVSFTGTGGAAPGMWPHAQLVVGADGNLYGATERGGSAADSGAVFKVTLGGTCTVLKAFTASGPHYPLSGLTAGDAGVFYGTTALGGTAGVGTLFKITDTGSFTVLANFGGASGTLRGAYPVGELLYAFDGALYGVAAESGANDAGTIFRFKSDNTAETLFDFTNTSGAVPGGAPRGGLIFGNDGYLYGATEEGGPRGGGVIYRLKNLGPMTVTDPINYVGLVATANGRAQTGGENTDVRFEIELLPGLLGLNLRVPANVTVNNGIAQFSMPVPTGLLGQLVYVRAYASNSSGVAEGIIRTTTALLPLQAWKTQYFNDPNKPDLDDTDNDGAKNLSEYALLKDPTVPNGSAAPAPIIKVYPEGARLAVFVTRDPARNDITIDVQAASSPSGPWTSVASSVNGAPFSGAGYVTGDNATSGVKTVEIKDVPPANATSRFLRVVASH